MSVCICQTLVSVNANARHQGMTARPKYIQCSVGSFSWLGLEQGSDPTLGSPPWGAVFVPGQCQSLEALPITQQDRGTGHRMTRTSGFPSAHLSVGCLKCYLESRGKTTILASQGFSEAAAWHGLPASEDSTDLTEHAGSQAWPARWETRQGAPQYMHFEWSPCQTSDPVQEPCKLSHHRLKSALTVCWLKQFSWHLRLTWQHIKIRSITGKSKQNSTSCKDPVAPNLPSLTAYPGCAPRPASSVASMATVTPGQRRWQGLHLSMPMPGTRAWQQGQSWRSFLPGCRPAFILLCRAHMEGICSPFPTPLLSLSIGSSCQMCFQNDPNMKCTPCSR